MPVCGGCVRAQYPDGNNLHPLTHSQMASVQFAEHSVEVAIVDLDAAFADEPTAGALLSDTERATASRLRLEPHRRRFIAGRAWLRRLLGERLGKDPASLSIANGEHGKPKLCIEESARDLRFSLSHSGGIAAYALSFDRELGIDIEVVRPVAEREEIVSRFFSTGERDTYFALAPDKRDIGFLTAWTRKEALVKATGQSLVNHLLRSSQSVRGEPARQRADFDDDQAWRTETFFPLPDVVASLVVALAEAEMGAYTAANGKTYFCRSN